MQLNIGAGSGGAFTEFVAMALGKSLTGNQFNPYTHDQLFLIAAFILEDVMVTAYQAHLRRRTLDTRSGGRTGTQWDTSVVYRTAGSVLTARPCEVFAVA